MNTENQLVKGSTEFSQISFPVSEKNGVGIGTIKYQPKQIATENKDILKGVIYLIESSGASYNDISIWSFREACERNNVNCQELIDAYWQAYSDPYVGKEGIQWRHLWKHIEVMRKGEDRKSYTYEQMLTKMDREYISMEAFTMIDEKDQKGRPKWVIK